MEATHYQMQVNTKADFSGQMVWDSGKVKLKTPLKDGERSDKVKYDGLTLPSDKRKYYWRIRFGTEKFALAWSDPAFFITPGKSKEKAKTGDEKG